MVKNTLVSVDLFMKKWKYLQNVFYCILPPDPCFPWDPCWIALTWSYIWSLSINDHVNTMLKEEYSRLKTEY